ncbi:phage tail protein [Marinobacterium sedimentorum]|uniref:phage tail protein n=1 Tax=Marinobacterium sedimentorum TaxID=2927804 RepID=UPI0020C637B1|nr:phage tail protein [Marinobacterium sedimentorum]
MKKPLQLRDFLLASVKELQANPEKLQIFIDSGNLHQRLQTDKLHFEYEYNLNLIVTDFSVHTDLVLVPLLAWLKAAQPEIAPDAIKFEADVIDHSRIDLSLTIPLSERVIVTQGEDGNYQTDHPAEPVPDYNLPDPAALQDLIVNE